MHAPARPYSKIFDDHYWSGGAAEKTFVFLHGNNLERRFPAAQAFTVAELGFGTGLNFLLTHALWRQTNPRGHLTYISYEQFPLPPEALRAIHPNLPPALAQPLAPGWNEITLAQTTLHLFIGDAAHGIATQPRKADAWFLDGFAPARNPQLWTPDLLAAVAAHTRPGGTCATYSAARMVKDALAAAGFKVERAAGHPPKRHMLKGRLAA